MIQLLPGLKTALEGALENELFKDPVGPDISPRIALGFLPPKRSDAAQNQDFPFIVIRAKGGRDTKSKGEVEVRLICGTWTNGDIESGVLEIHRLMDILRAWLPTHLGVCRPWVMDPDIAWEFGDKEDGKQPHPHYYGEIFLNFKRSPEANSRRSKAQGQ